MNTIGNSEENPPRGGMAGPVQRPVDLTMVLWMISLSALWGLNAVTIKALLETMPPVLAVGLRGASALILMIGYALWKGEPLVFRGRLLLHSLVIGVLFAVEFWLYYLGAQFTSGGHMAIFINTAPFFVALGAHLMLKDDRLFPARWAGLVLAFGGIVAVFSDDLYIQKAGFWRGDLLVILAAAGWGLTTLYMKRFMIQSMNGFQLLYVQIAVSTPLLLALSLATETFDPAGITVVTIVILAFQSVVVVFFSYVAWMSLLRIYPASAMQSFTFLTPVWGVMLGVVILGEGLTAAGVTGMALVGVGLMLINRARPGGR